ncbi:MAG TPA: (Fe-S)-binding protein [Candidatus Cloacimonetes bacterium]|nr:(Fe-S)-binding protein [Candidatus Cloacimonadota bacterium]
MEIKYLKQWETELNTCIRCGYCFEGCPVFKELGWEIDGARGKLITAYGLLTGKLEPTEYIAEKLFQCTFCRDCVERCSADVSVPDIMGAVRADLFDAGFSLPSHKVLTKKIEKSGNIFGKELKPPEFKGEKTVLLGCRLIERKEDSEKYLQILEKLGVKTKTFDETCCGMPFAVLGDKKGFKDQQDKFRDTIPNKDEEIICACTTCAFFIDNKYPDLKAKYIIDEIVERLPDYQGKLKKLNIKVTYHDPCNVARGMGMVDEPRDILKKICSDLVEMPTYGKQAECCGGGGGLLVTDDELAKSLAEKRVDQAYETGAEYFTTLCPTCELNLKNAAKKYDGKLKVVNLLDLLYESLN